MKGRVGTGPIRVAIREPGHEPVDVDWPVSAGLPHPDDEIILVEQQIVGRVFNVLWYQTIGGGWYVTINLRA